MGGMKISDLDFARLLPVFMRDDLAVKALSQAVNELMGDPSKRLSTIRTWDKIDELNDAECDELAWELDIDWYDSTGMSLQQKRETIKEAQKIKSKRGTKWAVERLISTYIGEGYVAEWYEVGGAPYTFMVLTSETDIQGENFDKFMEAVNASKNERSHIAGVFYYWPQEVAAVECAQGTDFHGYEYEKCGTRNRAATVGFVVPHSIETEPEETLHRYDLTKCGTAKCGADGVKATLGAAIVGTAIVGRAIIRS